MVSALLAAGANPNVRDEDGVAPLHLTARATSPETARLLLGAGANANARDEDSRTPLHRAALRGSPEMVTVLLGGGANPKVRDGDGNVPWDYAGGNEALDGTDALRRLRDGHLE